MAFPATFHSDVDEVVDYLHEVVRGGGSDFSSLNDHRDAIFLKNSEQFLLYSNQVFRRIFSEESPAIGRKGIAFLQLKDAKSSLTQDQLIKTGCRFLECEQIGHVPNGGVYRFLTQKRGIRQLGRMGITILGVTRVLQVLQPPKTSLDLDYEVACDRFLSLVERDREICRLTALGFASREIADRYGITTRGIELRKKKAMEQLGTSQSVDLVRLLVRIQDRGHLDLGL